MNTTHIRNLAFAALLAAAAFTACRGEKNDTPQAATAEEPLPETANAFDALPDSVRLAMDKPFTGDFDAMVERRLIRVAVTFNRTHYFIDKGQQRGLAYEALKSFEDDLNAERKTGNLKVNVWFGNVERVASERIGRETVQYASNIFKYYVAYRLILDQREQRDAAKAHIEKRP